ncbi:MAG: ATP-binding protein [Methylophilaceae bacterium]
MHFDLITATFVVGLMYCLFPVSVYVFLKEHRNLAVQLWTIGGIFGGIGFIIVSLRSELANIPTSITYTLPNALFFSGTLLRLQSLKIDCKQPIKKMHLLLGSLLFIMLYELAWRTLGIDQARNYLLPTFAIELLFVVQVAWVFEKLHGIKTIRVISYNYFLYACILLIKTLSVVFGSEVNQLYTAQSTVNIAMSLIAFTTVVYTNLGYVGIVLERVNRERTESLGENKKLVAILKKKEALITQYARTKAFSDIGGYGSSVIHEIAQPLTAAWFALENFSSLLTKQKDLPPQLTDRLNLVKTPIQQAIQIIKNLRKLMTKSDFAVTSVNLSEKINECLSILENKAKKTNVNIKVAPTIPAEMQVLADEAQINHVLINILDNALDAVANNPNPQEKREIVISITPMSKSVSIQFTDSGIGLSAKVILEMFNWLASNKTGGIGIGLALSKMFVESWGGKINARNAKVTQTQLSGAVIELILLTGNPDDKKE